MALDTALFDLLPAIPQIDVHPAKCAGLARQAARPELMKHEGVEMRPFNAESLEDQFALLGGVWVDAVLGISQRKGFEEITIKQVDL
jgi:hypothetical protein